MTSINKDKKEEAPLEDLNEVYAQELKNMEGAKQRLREKVIVKLFAACFGIAFAGALCWYMALFLFGTWSITEEGAECFAMEFPDTKQYSKDPLVENFEMFQGLTSVNITARFYGLFWAGFIIELLILTMIILNMISGNKLLSVSTILGYASFIWFIISLFYRFDHYGRVCAGDYLDEGATNTFKAIDRAA